MSSSPVGAQCPVTSSLGEFLDYRDWLWYPGLSPGLVSIALPFALPFLDVFYSLCFTCHWISFVYFLLGGEVSAPPHQTSSLFQTWDWHYGNWISEKVEIPWWWS